MKAALLFSDMKAWLYFAIGVCGAAGSVPELPWQVRASAGCLGAGLLAVKAYVTTPDGKQGTDGKAAQEAQGAAPVQTPALKSISPEGPATLPPEFKPPVKLSTHL